MTKERAARAGAVSAELEDLLGASDIVSVHLALNDGTRGLLTAEKLAQYRRSQMDMLDSAARLVKPGGRLIYATCSILRCENEDMVDGFLSRNRAFVGTDVDRLWPRLFSAQLPPGTGHDFRASPLKTGTDGFFASIMRVAP